MVISDSNQKNFTRIWKMIAWPRKTNLPGASKLTADHFQHDPVLFPMEDF
jgi:hypothetical protein